MEKKINERCIMYLRRKFNNMIIKYSTRLFKHRIAIIMRDSSTIDRYNWIKQHLQGGPLKTLDAGCGNGAITLYALIKGNNVTAINNNAIELELARNFCDNANLSNVQFVNHDLRDLDKLTSFYRSFDQIICCEVIEHILDDEKLILDLSNMLKPGGKIYLTTPFDYTHFSREIRSKTEDGGHVRWGYNQTNLKEMLNKSNIEIISFYYICSYMATSLVNVSKKCYNQTGGSNSLIGRLIVFSFRLGYFLIRPIIRLRCNNRSIALIGVKR